MVSCPPPQMSMEAAAILGKFPNFISEMLHFGAFCAFEQNLNLQKTATGHHTKPPYIGTAYKSMQILTWGTEYPESCLK